ncbi:hypothetical protein [Thermus antranikianii]|nr:hypothetical protein [Thermus antranikianii]
MGALVVYTLYGTHPEGALFAGTLATVLLHTFGRRLGLRFPTPR